MPKQIWALGDYTLLLVSFHPLFGIIAMIKLLKICETIYSTKCYYYGQITNYIQGCIQTGRIQQRPFPCTLLVKFFFSFKEQLEFLKCKFSSLPLQAFTCQHELFAQNYLEHQNNHKNLFSACQSQNWFQSVVETGFAAAEEGQKTWFWRQD